MLTLDEIGKEIDIINLEVSIDEKGLPQLESFFQFTLPLFPTRTHQEETNYSNNQET